MPKTLNKNSNIMDRYIYINSDESDGYFQDNKVYKFKVHLNTPLFFEGFWKVALTEFYAERDNQAKVSKFTNTDIILISSDIISESIVLGNEQPILRRMRKTSTTAWNYVFDSPYYLPLKKKQLMEFEITIKDGNNEDFASFLKSPVHLTLHFKRYPFYANHESL